MPIITPTREELKEACKILQFNINMPSIIESLNEDVTIPSQLANQYLSVKKQIADKQSKRDQLMKTVNQMDNEMNILNKNLIAIETKAAELQGKEGEVQKKPSEQAQGTKPVEAQGTKPVEAQGTKPVEVQGTVKESIDLDLWWRENVSEAMDDEDNDKFDLDQEIYDRNPDYDVEGEGEEFEDEEEEDEREDSLEGDYVFAVKVIDGDEEEDIIAKFYKNEDDDFWKARVVQGSEEPIESMQFDPEMEKLDIIEHLATIYDEVEELDTEDYEEMLDDKDVIDDIFYDDIVK